MFDTLSINCSFPNLDDGLHNRSDVSNIPSPFTVNEVNMSSIQIAATNQLYDWSSAFAWDAFESGLSWIKLCGPKDLNSFQYTFILLYRPLWT